MFTTLKKTGLPRYVGTGGTHSFEIATQRTPTSRPTAVTSCGDNVFRLSHQLSSLGFSKFCFQRQERLVSSLPSLIVSHHLTSSPRVEYSSLMWVDVTVFRYNRDPESQSAMITSAVTSARF